MSTPGLIAGFPFLSRGPVCLQGIKLCVATFNLGNAPLDAATLHLWLDPGAGYDVVAVGLQESWTGAFASFGGSAADPTRGDSVTTVLERHLGPKYTKLVETSRGEMRLILFTHATPKQPVHSVEVSAENTGALGIAPNKGGLVARCVFGATSLCFIACHLQAHEGSRNCAARNKSCEEILSGARVGNRLLDASAQHHHTFFFGDLNYRVDLALPMDYSAGSVAGELGLGGEGHGVGPGWTGDEDFEGPPSSLEGSGDGDQTAAAVDSDAAVSNQASHSGMQPTRTISGASRIVGMQPTWTSMGASRMDTGAQELAHQAKFELATTLLSLGSGGRQRLLAHDELLQALSEQTILGRFNTVAPQFLPTFKVLKGAVDGYNAKRIPSWCDRVLWCSLPGAAPALHLTDYSAASEVTSSDHKPVSATFRLQTALPVLVAPLCNDITTTVLLTDLAARDLPIMDGVLQGGKADPYIELHVLPPFAGPSIPVRTPVIPKDLNPRWGSPLIAPIFSTPRTAAGVHVVLCVKDRDVGSTDDVIGTTSLSLSRAMEEPGGRKRYDFDEPLFHNGVLHGSISGTLEFIISEAVR